MQRYKRLLAILMVAIMGICLLSGCNANKPTGVLDFENYSNEALSKLQGEEVTLYGYFALNSAVDNMTYMTRLPFTALINNQTEEVPQFFDVKLSDGAMPVYFKEEPEYTTAPVKVTGKLTRVKTYDEMNFISFEYAITDATYSPVEGYALGVGFKEFVTFAKMGYPDVAYQNILQLELFSYDYLDNFPEEKEYENIMKDMERAPDQAMYNEYVDLIEDIHLTFEHYKKQLSEKGSVSKADVMADANTLVKALIEFMDKYASFNLVYDKEAGYYKLESANVVYVPNDGTTTKPTTSEPTTDKENSSTETTTPETTPETKPNNEENKEN